MHPTLQKLREGDRRSIGRSNEVVSEVLSNPRLFGVVFSGLSADDPLIRMRSADAVEKITAQRPELLRPYKNKLIRDVSATQQKEVRWHVAQMLPRLELNEEERKRVFRLLLGYLNDSSSIVRTLTMQALADIGRDSAALLPSVRQHLAELSITGSPAMKARGRKLLHTLNGLTARSTATHRKRRAPQRGR
jgi:HEAT repeat protein